MSEGFDFDRYDDGDGDSWPDAMSEEVAETQKALDAERDAIDAAQEEHDAALDLDGHEQEREELHGNGLLWWRDTSLFDAHVAMGDLFEEALMTLDRTNALIDAGLDPGTMSVETVLTMKTGPLVISALQLLGLFVPELREECAQFIKDIEFSVATPEENEAIEAAIERVNEATRERVRNALQKAADESTRRGRLGLDPN